uniref:Reverse transcriptase domain-containing protein n=1 Tax=Monopterus albus TaxID=43700 RepID=A0A3Q3JGV0_MONAL
MLRKKCDEVRLPHFWCKYVMSEYPSLATLAVNYCSQQPMCYLLSLQKSFSAFYCKFCSPNYNPNSSEIDIFLDSLELPILSIEQTDRLDAPLTIGNCPHLFLCQITKSPGPDGLPAELVTPTISGLGTGVCVDVLWAACVLKDPIYPSFYHPLSLNSDLKIITKALATRIETVTPILIHPNQTGFIKNRNASDKIRRLFNLINLAQQKLTKTIIVSLDAEKAFDKVNWTFLFCTLRRFGFRELFIHWIQPLYTSPRPTISTNGIRSQSFILQQGTRQGCPLSPSLFAIFIKPLTAAIRQNNIIKVLQDTYSEHKISLYADDLLLYLQDPYNSLEETLHIINTFSKISNFTINWNKSTILPLSEDCSNRTSSGQEIEVQSRRVAYCFMDCLGFGSSCTFPFDYTTWFYGFKLTQ